MRQEMDAFLSLPRDKLQLLRTGTVADRTDDALGVDAGALPISRPDPLRVFRGALRRDQVDGDAAEAAALARTRGQVWQASPTAGLYAITADADFEAHFGKKAAKRRKIYNGMIPCQIYMYFDRPVKPVRK